MAKKKYAVVGTGGRAWSFIGPMIGDYKNHCELVGLCDVNQGRLDYHVEKLAEEGYPQVPTFEADPKQPENLEAFEKMIAETKPDAVLVTTVDGYHHQYIIRAMELGCDAITEKPMTVNAEKCNAILEAKERTGKDVRVTFNYRFGAAATHVKKLLSEGIVGRILSVDMEYLLDVSHGADYFRRWHRYKDKSGGLMVHKATHHFDLVNWWIDAVPEQVFGFGSLKYYGKENAASRGQSYDYEVYTDNVTPDQDPFAIDLKDKDASRKLYYEAAKYDGYRRDMNVFADDITIEDSMSVLVNYRTGVTLTYSLNAFLPKEGYQIVFNGEKGRLSLDLGAAPHLILGEEGEADVKYEHNCFFHPSFGKPERIELPKAQKGGHGGADPVLHEQIFDPTAPTDPFGRNAGEQQGAASIMIGISANESFASGKMVSVSERCPLLPGVAKLSELR